MDNAFDWLNDRLEPDDREKGFRVRFVVSVMTFLLADWSINDVRSPELHALLARVIIPFVNKHCLDDDNFTTKRHKYELLFGMTDLVPTIARVEQILLDGGISPMAEVDGELIPMSQGWDRLIKLYS